MSSKKELLAAARNGNADAMYKLGEIYYHGYGIDKNIEEAAEWYRKALKTGYIPEINAQEAEEMFGSYESREYTPAEWVDGAVGYVATTTLEVAVRFFVSFILLVILTVAFGGFGFFLGVAVGLYIIFAK